MECSRGESSAFVRVLWLAAIGVGLLSGFAIKSGCDVNMDLPLGILETCILCPNGPSLSWGSCQQA